MPRGVRWTSAQVDRHEPRSRRRPRLLLVCDYRPYEAATVLDHIEAIRAWSRYEVFVLPFFGDLPDELDLDAFDGLLIHYNVVMSNAAYLSPFARWRISQFRGLKAALVQDEYRFVYRTMSVMRTLGINVLFTNVPQDQVALVYPSEALPAIKRMVTVLTGYVAPSLLSRPVTPYDQRTVDVGYRGRRLPAWLGRLGQEKSMIADRFGADASKYGLSIDLSCREEDRLYGGAWIDFLSRSKAMLGVESGASVFDFDGSIELAVRESIASQPEISFDQLHRMHLAEVEGRIRLNQISPRCFEAAALGTLMVLYPGHYSGVLEPWRHYVPLQKDHSNMDEVARTIRDRHTWERITKQARHEVALNPRYGFRAMVEVVDDGLDLRITADTPVDAAAFDQIASKNFARMPLTELRAFGLPPAINRVRLLSRRAVRVLTPNPLAMSVSAARPETSAHRLRHLIGYARTLTYWAMRPRVLSWALLVRYRGALLRELTELGRLQEFGARAMATGTDSPFAALVSEATRSLCVVLREDSRVSGRPLPGMPTDLSWVTETGLSLHFTDPWRIPPGIGESPERPLPALSAVLQARPDVGRGLLAGRAPWCQIVVVGEGASSQGSRAMAATSSPTAPSRLPRAASDGA